MGVAKPSGEYADEMLDPGGWVQIDEQSLHDRAQVLTTTLRQVTSALEGFQHEETEIFGGGIWSGGGANSAQGKLGDVVSDLKGVQDDLVKAITWYQNVADTVAQTKSAIADRVDATQQQITELESNSDSDADDQSDAIDALVNKAHSENIKDVNSAAASVPTAGTWKPPANALQNLLNQKAPPTPTKPGESPPAAPQQPGQPAAGAHGSAMEPGPNPPATAGYPGAPSGTTPPPSHPGVSTAVAAAGKPPAAPAAGLGRDPAAANAGPGAPGAVAPPPPAAPAAGLGRDPAAVNAGPGAPGAPPPRSMPAAALGRDPAAANAGTGGVPGAPPLPDQWSPAIPPAPGSIGPNDVVRQVGGGLGGFSGGGGGGGGHGGGDMSSMFSNAFGGQQGGQQNPYSAEAFEHHLERQDAGLQQAVNQAAVNNAASAAASAATNAAAQLPLADAAPMAPAAAHGFAAAEGSAAAAPAGGGAVSAGSHAGGAVSASMSSTESSASSMPLLPPATPHAAAPVSATGGGGAPGSTAAGSGGPGVHPASTSSVGRGGFSGSVTSSQAEAAPAPIPVSSARAQKEAIAGATRRQDGGDVQVAYRLAAALNAADVVNKSDFKFFWMTAVTADGQIVVANSYGLAFIPDGVKLPPQVTMVSADQAVPVDERARWATYPNLALQGWAAHHNTTLRIVIAKREHFAGIDPGVPTQFVADEDIPASGKMQGRSRLEVIDPAEASRLASLSDLGLVELLPPAPVDASPPADQRSTLWFDLMKHLMSSDADRGVAHLQSFTTYAKHAQELALHRAHCAVHAVEQRDAVADWLYWQRIAALLDEALAGAAR